MNLLAHTKHADVLFVSSNTDGAGFMQLVLMHAHLVYDFVESVNTGSTKDVPDVRKGYFRISRTQSFLSIYHGHIF